MTLTRTERVGRLLDASLLWMRKGGSEISKGWPRFPKTCLGREAGGESRNSSRWRVEGAFCWPVCLLVFFWSLAARHVGSQFRDQGWNPRPLHWKHGVLTTGPPGKSLLAFFKSLGLFSKVRGSERERGSIFRKKRGTTDGYKGLSRPKAGINKGEVEGLAFEDISPFKMGGKKIRMFREMSISVVVAVGWEIEKFHNHLKEVLAAVICPRRKRVLGSWS